MGDGEIFLVKGLCGITSYGIVWCVCGMWYMDNAW